MERAADGFREPCPWLPVVAAHGGFDRTRRHGPARGAEFYADALHLAQELWMLGKPAQAILQLNKAWMADIPPDDPVLLRFPPPYAALRWLLEQAGRGNHGFLGDPVRHFQHLASRMSGPRSETRAWRAWACHHLARRVMTGGEASPDGRQIAREGLWIPRCERVMAELQARGWPGEAAYARRAIDGPGNLPPGCNSSKQIPTPAVSLY